MGAADEDTVMDEADVAVDVVAAAVCVAADDVAADDVSADVAAAAAQSFGFSDAFPSPAWPFAIFFFVFVFSSAFPSPAC